MIKKLSYLLLSAVLTVSIFAAQQTINLGSSANDGTGDTLRAGGTKINENFTELYAASPTTGTFTITWDDACTTSPTTAVTYNKVGNIVSWRLGTMSGTNCTSDSTAFQGTGLDVPAAIRPSVQQNIIVNNVKNNSNVGPGCIEIRTTGTVGVNYESTTGTTFCQGGSWTNTGSKWVAGSASTTITYQLN